MKKSSFIIAGLCILITVFSISFRLPSLLSEKVFDYEWHTATVLRHLLIWDTQGGIATGFVPGVTYDGAINKNINNHSSIEEGRSGYADAEGNYYYVSYPPFAYMAPYALFWSTGTEPNVVGLRFFNLFTQLATAGLLFLLLYRMTQNAYAGLLAYSVYLLTAVSLYVHTVNYMSDMFVQLFFVLTALLFYEVVKKDALLHSARAYLPLGIALALMVYTEWLGLFVCAFIFFYALLNRTQRYFLPLVILSTAIPITVLLLTVVQYASVADLQSFVSVMADRYLHGYDESSSDSTVLSQLQAIARNYTKWFGIVFFTVSVLGAALAFALLKSRSGRKLPAIPKATIILLFFAVPVLLHHATFFDWTAFRIHFYSILKSAPFFCVLIAFFMHLLWSFDFGRATRLFKGGSLVLLFILFAGSLSVYAQELRLRDKGDSNAYCNLGELIKERTASDEVAFMKAVSQERFNNIISAVIIVCAERNVQLYEGMEKASALMELNGTTKGVLYTIDYHDNIIQFVKSEPLLVGPTSSGQR